MIRECELGFYTNAAVAFGLMCTIPFSLQLAWALPKNGLQNVHLANKPLTVCELGSLELFCRVVDDAFSDRNKWPNQQNIKENTTLV